MPISIKKGKASAVNAMSRAWRPKMIRTILFGVIGVATVVLTINYMYIYNKPTGNTGSAIVHFQEYSSVNNAEHTSSVSEHLLKDKDSNVVNKPTATVTVSSQLQPMFVGKNGLLVSNSSCCDFAMGKSLEELCAVDFNGAIHALQEADPFSKLTEYEDKTVQVKEQSGCSCDDYLYCKLVVVTGFSSNHFKEAQSMIASVQLHLPNTSLVIYDLGLNVNERDVLKHYCNVELRNLVFSKYPKYISNLATYAFKPIIIQEVAQEYEVVFWGDASARMLDFPPKYLFKYLKQFPYVPGPGSGFPSVSLTHDGMLNYLNITRSRDELNKHYTEFEGNIIMVWINRFLFNTFLQHWFDCALHEECIAPKGTSPYGCNFAKMKNGVYVGCHRFDQSALNMVMLREYGLGINKVLYHTDTVAALAIERHPSKHVNIKKCNYN